ncbi:MULTISPECIES: Crp/Fnr family transcriptional regulator [Modicisalibacter]|nr:MULTISPECIES: Crp/Fnr family transcriptional regulator [Halomonadaceae]MBZ9576771.1 Crp/Fnr family transcriptional regulator [Modicisalibacter sp. MOD 31.J]
MPAQERYMARNIGHHLSLSKRDHALLAELEASPRPVAKGTVLWESRTTPDQLYTLCEGWAYTSQCSADGSRQILDLFLPGDIMGLRDLTYHDHSTTAVMLTDGVVSPFPIDRLPRLMRRSARLAWALQASAARQEGLITQRMVNVLSHDAASRIAHFVLEVHHRLQRIEETSGDSFDLPLLQRQFSMLLGMSSVHVSRTLVEMANRGLIQRSRRNIRLLDFEALNRMADFDPNTLNDNLNPHIPLTAG